MSAAASSAGSAVAGSLQGAGLSVQTAPAEVQAFRIGDRTPLAVAYPETARQAAQALALAHAAGWGVVPWGVGLDMAAGRAPSRYHLALSLARLARVSEHDAENLTVTALAGLSLAETNRQLRAKHQFLALGWDGEAHTLGGLIAGNRPVPRRLLYGDIRDQLLGLTVATPDGRLVRYGRKVIKNVAGYDMNKLYTGSAGMLGVIVDVTLKLFALPDDGAVAVACFDAARSGAARSGAEAAAGQAGTGRAAAGQAAALAAAAELFRSALAPAFLVLMDGSGARSSLAASAADESPALTWLCAGFEGRAVGVRRQTADALALMARHGGADGRVMPRLSPAARQGWQAPASAPGAILLRGGVAPGRLGWLAGEVRRLAEARGMALALAADYGGGMLRCGLGGKDVAGADPAQLAAGLQRLRALLEAERGYLLIERAPAVLMEQLGPWGELGGEAALMRVLRRQMDPQEILVPGRFL